MSVITALRSSITRFQGLPAAHSEQLSGQQRRPLAGLERFFRTLAQGVVLGQMLQQDLTECHDARQEIVDVMYNASSQSSECFHLLGLVQLLLEFPSLLFKLLSFGDILSDGNDSDGSARQPRT